TTIALTGVLPTKRSPSTNHTVGYLPIIALRLVASGPGHRWDNDITEIFDRRAALLRGTPPRYRKFLTWGEQPAFILGREQCDRLRAFVKNQCIPQLQQSNVIVVVLSVVRSVHNDAPYICACNV